MKTKQEEQVRFEAELNQLMEKHSVNKFLVVAVLENDSGCHRALKCTPVDVEKLFLLAADIVVEWVNDHSEEISSPNHAKTFH